MIVFFLPRSSRRRDGEHGGSVIAVDNHQPYLDTLVENAEKAGLSHRITPIRGSMFEMDFDERSFDLVWSEGSIYIIGFEKGLKEWKSFIKPGGFLVAAGNTKFFPQELLQKS